MICLDPDWRLRLKNFDAVFAPVTDAANTPRPTPGISAATVDLGAETAWAGTPVETVGEEPPSMTHDEFKAKYTNISVTISLTLAQAVTCFVADGKVFLLASSKLKVGGVNAHDAKSVIMYAGGGWISESSKAEQNNYVLHTTLQAQDYLSKQFNENRGVEFRINNENQHAALIEVVLFQWPG